jgi:predicted DNA-binding transcriptional regulator AlpA
MPKQAALPPTLAPRLICREAAAYVNVSPSTFDGMVEQGAMPKPRILVGRRKAWDLRDLEGGGPSPAGTTYSPCPVMPCSSRRITIAWRASGTRCGRFIFMVAAGNGPDRLLETAARLDAESWSARRVVGLAAVAPFRSLAAARRVGGLGDGGAMFHLRRVVSAPRRSSAMSRLARPVAIE